MNASLFTARAAQSSPLDAEMQRTLANAEHVDRHDDDGRILDSARQLEAVFLGMMFSEMAKTVTKDNSLFPESPGQDLYEEWFRTEVAKEWAANGGTGLGDTIARSMGVDPKVIETHRTNTFRGPDYIRNNARLPRKGHRSDTRSQQVHKYVQSAGQIDLSADSAQENPESRQLNPLKFSP